MTSPAEPTYKSPLNVRLLRLLGRHRWLSALSNANSELAARVVRLKRNGGNEARADEWLEELHVAWTRYLRESRPELSEAERNNLAWSELVKAMPAWLVVYEQAAE